MRKRDLMKFAKKNFNFAERSIVANYGFMQEDGDILMSSTQVCHAGINHPPHTRKPFVAIVSEILGTGKDGLENLIRRQELGEEIVIEYYDWLLNESPVSHVFITKDAEQAIKDKLIVLDTANPRAVLLAACIMHRHVWEEIKVPRVWHDLVKAGVDKDGAFVLAHCFGIGYADYENLGKQLVPLSIRSSNNNHNIFYGELYAGKLTNFIAHNIVGAEIQNFKDATERDWPHFRISGLFGGWAHRNDLLANIRESVVELLVAGSEERQESNPFAIYEPRDKNSNRYLYSELIEAIAEAYPKICEKDAAK